MFKRINNKKGFLFGFLGTTASVFMIIALAAVGVSQLPEVKNDFRAKKAVQLCEENYRNINSPDCQAEVSAMTEDQILTYIKDDIEVPQPVMRERLGG